MEGLTALHALHDRPGDFQTIAPILRPIPQQPGLPQDDPIHDPCSGQASAPDSPARDDADRRIPGLRPPRPARDRRRPIKTARSTRSPSAVD